MRLRFTRARRATAPPARVPPNAVPCRAPAARPAAGERDVARIVQRHPVPEPAAPTSVQLVFVALRADKAGPIRAPSARTERVVPSPCEPRQAGKEKGHRRDRNRIHGGTSRRSRTELNTLPAAYPN